MAEPSAKKARSEFFPSISKIQFEGPQSINPLAFKYYQPDEVIMGKKMRHHFQHHQNFADKIDIRISPANVLQLLSCCKMHAMAHASHGAGNLKWNEVMEFDWSIRGKMLRIIWFDWWILVSVVIFFFACVAGIGADLRWVGGTPSTARWELILLATWRPTWDRGMWMLRWTLFSHEWMWPLNSSQRNSEQRSTQTKQFTKQFTKQTPKPLNHIEPGTNRCFFIVRLWVNTRYLGIRAHCYWTSRTHLGIDASFFVIHTCIPEPSVFRRLIAWHVSLAYSSHQTVKKWFWTVCAWLIFSL